MTVSCSPQEKGPEWYGMSADTISRGITGLKEHNLLLVNKTFKLAPLSPVGYTEENRYTLAAPFGPVGRKRAQRAITDKAGTSKGFAYKAVRRVRKRKPQP